MSDSTSQAPLLGASVRPLSEDDLDRLAEIEKRVHVAPWDRSHFEAELQKSYSKIWVLTDDETDSEILGYVVFWEMEQAIEILNIAVDLPYRGQGFAKKMMHQVISHALKQDLENLILDVRKSNLDAVSLYQSCGLSITQYRKGFYSNGEDAYHMTLELKGERIEF
jgi:ribosomal-protein-alanine N-acetyltransferase